MFSKNSLSLFVIMLIAFVDLVGIGLVYPMFAPMIFQGDCHLLPPDASDALKGACLGILLATMPITHFFCAPILGMLSDQIGRKKVLVPSLAIGIVGYCIATTAVLFENLPLLIFSRIAIGISAGTSAVVSAAIADVSTPEAKAKNFGLLNMAFGLGFTVGPFLGGILSGMQIGIFGNYSLPFVLAGTVCVLNFIMVLWFFENTYEPKASGKLNMALGIYNIKKALSMKSLQAVLLAVFLACVGWSFYWEFAPVGWINDFEFTTAEVGNFFAYGAAVYALSCGLFIRPIVDRFCNLHVLCCALISCCLSIGLLLFHTNPLWLWLYIPLQQFSMALFWPTASAVVSNSVSEDVQGETLGILQSVDSLAFAISPLIAGPLLGITTAMPIMVGSGAFFCAALTMGISLRKKKFAVVQT